MFILFLFVYVYLSFIFISSSNSVSLKPADFSHLESDNLCFYLANRLNFSPHGGFKKVQLQGQIPEEAESLAQRTNKNEEQMESYNSGRSKGLLCLQKVNWGQESKVVSGKALGFIHIEVL